MTQSFSLLWNGGPLNRYWTIIPTSISDTQIAHEKEIKIGFKIVDTLISRTKTRKASWYMTVEWHASSIDWFCNGLNGYWSYCKVLFIDISDWTLEPCLAI